MQIRLQLPAATFEALATLAGHERRDARAQAETLLIRALYREGLVTSDGKSARPDKHREGRKE